MAVPQDENKDEISAKVLKQLSQTVYACSSLTQLSSRPGNFVYRGILCQPFTRQDGTPVASIIIKHCTQDETTDQDNPRNVMRCVSMDYPCLGSLTTVPHVSRLSQVADICYPFQKFEQYLFNSVADLLPATTAGTLIKSPRVYRYDLDTNIQIFEDFSNATMFKPMIFSASATTLFPRSSLAIIGHHLGSWLRSFHNWATAPEQAGLRGQMLRDDPMRKLKYTLTYGGFFEVLEKYPELLKGHKKTLESIRDAMTREFEQPGSEQDENWGLIHGDFWPGK